MTDVKAAFERIHAAAMAYPEAVEESPWGERVVKVRKKVFVFLGRGDGSYLGMSLKIPESRDEALSLPRAAPTGYGLGKSGWVSLRFEVGDPIPEARLLDWLDESYRNVAPKTLVKALAGRPDPAPAPAPTLVGRRVLVVGDDPLRRERARIGLVERGADAVAVDLAAGLETAGAGNPDLVVVDLSRHAVPAMALLADLGLVVQAPIVAAGVRDAAMQRQLQGGAPLAGSSREPPGDPGFLDGLVDVLAAAENG